MSPYDHEQRVRIIAGPHRYCTGIVQSMTPPERGRPGYVSIALDTSGRVVVVELDAVRPERAGNDWEDAT